MSDRPAPAGEGEAELVDRREVFAGRTIRLTLDTVRLPNGRTVELERVHHPGAAAIVPLLPGGEVLLVRQYRWATSGATGGWLLEVPAGKLDPGEAPERCAARELAEETGHEPGELVPLGWIWTTPGFADERIWLYLATGLRPVRQNLGTDEVLTLERLPLNEAVERAANGEMTDAKSVCALLRAARHLRLETP